ncbi:MAG: hypothetical protein ACPGRG_11330 [Marinomonas sp.]
MDSVFINLEASAKVMLVVKHLLRKRSSLIAYNKNINQANAIN